MMLEYNGTHLQIKKACLPFAKFEVKNKKGDFLGYLYYHPPWKRIVWSQDVDAIMASNCLKELTEFMNVVAVKK